MQLISETQLTYISGSKVQEFIPDPIPGHELIGWQQTIVRYDTTTREDRGWFWTSYTVTEVPIFEFTPIFVPR